MVYSSTTANMPMPSDLIALYVGPIIRSEHPADSSSLQLSLKITSEVHLNIPGQTSPATAKTAAVTFGTSLHLWSTDPSAARSDVSRKFASLGLGSLSQKLLVQTIEARLPKLFKSELPAAFEVDINITHIKSSSSLEARNGDGSVCSICLEETAESGAATPCGHVFHGHCIAMWLHKRSSCPLCRSMLL